MYTLLVLITVVDVHRISSYLGILSDALWIQASRFFVIMLMFCCSVFFFLLNMAYHKPIACNKHVVEHKTFHYISQMSVNVSP